MDKSRLIEQVKKLYAMSASASSPNEAETAARMMRNLMKKHGLKLEDLETTDMIAERFAGYKRQAAWLLYLHEAAAVLCECRSVVHSNKRDRTRHAVIEGADADVTVAKMTLDYLWGAMDKGIAKADRVEKRDRKWKNSYRNMFANNIARRARELMREEMDDPENTTGKELMVIKNDKIAEHFGDTKKMMLSTNISSNRGAAAGWKDGGNVGLSKQIGGGTPSALISN